MIFIRIFQAENTVGLLFAAFLLFVMSDLYWKNKNVLPIFSPYVTQLNNYTHVVFWIHMLLMCFYSNLGKINQRRLFNLSKGEKISKQIDRRKHKNSVIQITTS